MTEQPRKIDPQTFLPIMRGSEQGKRIRIPQSEIQAVASEQQPGEQQSNELGTIMKPHILKRFSQVM